ncbi:hypothetical protein G6F56_007733 [Rhizopus delemar]|nr:hypothetical protein G6F56_007733 [Rhizopus delemar]
MKHKPFSSTFDTESRSQPGIFERELIGTPTSSQNYNFDTCACCGNQECDTLEDYNKTIKKLECDTRLAAEIGQGLLNKHEIFVAESNQHTAKLSKQLEECYTKIRELEQSLDQAEFSKEELLVEKNQLFRKHQKKQKTLDEVISDLELSNERCQQLTAELQSKNNELEKLRVFKFMVRQSEIREETLGSKLEDTYQELAICRKNELLLESKIKKLKMKYESLYNNCHNTLKFTPQPPDNHDNLATYINELSSTNNKLKSDILNYKEQLSNAREEIDHLHQKIQYKSTQPRNSLQKEKKRAESIHCKENYKPAHSKTNIIPSLPTVSSSMPTAGPSSPVVHHHYHYYMKNKAEGGNTDCCDEMVVPTERADIPQERSLSPDEIKYPFVVLQDQISQVLDRLHSSDIRALNRKLKRAFDIIELSSMSNSVIENIVIDIDTLDNQFLWLKEEGDLFAFSSFLEILKDALKELGLLKLAVNEMQVAYVQKVKENESRVEEEILRKRTQKRQKRAQESPLYWLTSIFYKSSSSNHVSEEDENTLVRSYKDEPLVRDNRRNHRHKLSPAVPIVRSKRSFHRIEEGAPIRSMMIPSDNVNNSNGDIPTVNLSSSWLGGK